MNYVLVGTGGRGVISYQRPLTHDFADCAKITAVYDLNRKRAELAAAESPYEIKVYDDFDLMLRTEKPDAVIVTSKDSTHDEYIVKALDFGCDVISEKPVTMNAEKMKAILDAEKRSGKKVTVTFNCRFMPVFMRVKELVASGAIGTPFSAHYEWLLDTVHGADYFRRWHRERKNSGSLLIHKSTHHFDLLNWFLDDEPEKVNAFGTRRFYGDSRRNHGKRCYGCKYAGECEFYFDIKSDKFNREFYFECEDADGYYRDGCVFSEDIDIEDTVSLNVRYKKGAVVSYSLTAHSPYEGMRICINGSEGRLELTQLYSSGLFAGGKKATIVLYNRLGEKIDIEPHSTETLRKFPKLARALDGGHSGSDGMLKEMIFRGGYEDPLGLLANSRAGAMSIGIGIAANISMKENRAVDLCEFYDFI